MQHKVGVRSSDGSLPAFRSAIPGVFVGCAAGGSDHLLGRNTVNLVGVYAHEILASAGDEVSLVATGKHVMQ
jgi:hypothetical protein